MPIASVMELVNSAVDMLFSERYSFYRNVAAVVGATFLLKIAVKELFTLASGFRAFFLAPWGVSRTNLRKYGSWASEPPADDETTVMLLMILKYSYHRSI